MSDPRPITIKVKSLTGKVVDIQVLEILEIDGSSQAQFEGALRLERIEQRLDALETAVNGENDG